MLRPADTPIISWETALFTLARILFVFAGILNGVLSVLLSRHLDFCLTPKRDRRGILLPFRALLPFFLVSVLSSMAVIGLAHRNAAIGYYFLSFSRALLLAIVIMVLHHQENGWQQRGSLVKGSLQFVAAHSLAIKGVPYGLAKHCRRSWQHCGTLGWPRNPWSLSAKPAAASGPASDTTITTAPSAAKPCQGTLAITSSPGVPAMPNACVLRLKRIRSRGSSR